MHTVEKLGESGGHCACCGQVSQTIWGLIHNGPATLAAYWTSWTEGQLAEHDAAFDLIIGQWGDSTSSADRAAVSLVYRAGDGGGFMVVDAKPRKTLADHELSRDDVIGSPLAEQIYGLVDTIWEHDDRLFRS